MNSESKQSAWGSVLRVGIICYPTIGGSGIVATSLGRALCERRYSVHFISHDLPQSLGKLKEHCRFHHIQVPVYPLFRFPPYTLALATELTRLVQEVPLDVLHLHYAIPHSTSAVLANMMLEDKGIRRVPLITTVHGTDTELVGKEPSYKPAVEFSLNHCDCLTAVSKSLKESTMEAFDCRRPIEIIHNFVDPEVFYPPEGNCFPRNPKYWQLVHVSNFRPVKRVLDVIKVFDTISSAASSRLVMVGDGPDRAEAENLVCSLGLSNRVIFTGRIVNVEKILRNSDVLISTSSSESFGMSIAEAMASGVPVVATEVGGVPEVIEDGVTGVLTTPGNLNEMAEAILSIISEPEKAQRMGKAGRSRVLSRFSPGVIVPQYEALYRQLAKR
jgi:N-acetyl-alpha-D-glucosaminyl L-malate synthase BshA